MIRGLAIYFLSLGMALSGQLSFSLMENGDRVELTEYSKGCFHDRVSYYEVTKQDGRYWFTQYSISWVRLNVIGEKTVIGRIPLDEHDVKKLDGLLRFYRGKKEASSTTRTTLLVEYFEPAHRVGVERLEDTSGGSDSEKRQDVITFWELSERFKASEE